MRSHKRGFTLVELLVVIAIIALLLSVLMPALNKARESGKRIKCTAQTKQIGTAMMLYANEYHDYYLPYQAAYIYVAAGAPDPAASLKADGFWSSMYKKYGDSGYHWYRGLVGLKLLPDQKLFRCPAHTITAAMAKTFTTSYGMNIAFCHDYSVSGFPAKVWKTMEIKQPSTKIVAVDSGNSWYWARYNNAMYSSYCVYGWWKDPSRTPPGDAMVAWPRHGGGYCDVVWADGHSSSVRATNPKDPSTLYADQALTTQSYQTPNNWVVRY